MRETKKLLDMSHTECQPAGTPPGTESTVTGLIHSAPTMRWEQSLGCEDCHNDPDCTSVFFLFRDEVRMEKSKRHH